MKKIFAILMTICLMASLLCVTAFAAESTSNGTMGICGLKEDGTLEAIKGGSNFEEIWEAAVDYALDHDYMDRNGYDRIVVDLYGDWNANEDGEFGSSWDGFAQSTIYVPSHTKMTINMNGHTINRRLEEKEYDGEVIWVGSDADLIINGGKSGDEPVMTVESVGNTKVGIITGGYSRSGAGGIHIEDDATVTLNNVVLFKNRVIHDMGSAIAIYNGATLIMNGGAFLDNTLYAYDSGSEGTLYVDDSVAVLNNVIFRGNNGHGSEMLNGVLVSTNGDADVMLNGCWVYDNLFSNSWSQSAFYCDDSACTLTLNETKINNIGNRLNEHVVYGGEPGRLPCMFESYGTININKCTIEDGKISSIFGCYNGSDGIINVVDTEISNCRRFIRAKDTTGRWVSFSNNQMNFTNCKISNVEDKLYGYSVDHLKVTLTDCEFENVKWSGAQDVWTFIDSTKSAGVGSIFGEGSLAMIVAILALVASGVSIFLTVYYNKKKAAPVAANGVAETETDDEE